jgi:pimeloyl-ACP methyl ester carboxylesterase
MKAFDHQSGQYLAIGDARIYYEVAGTSGKPILLVMHGGFGTLEDMSAIYPELYRAFTLVGIDSRGHGKSTPGTQELTYERLQKDAELVLQHLNIEILSILGFSDGGIAAYRLAAFSNLKIQKLVTIGSSWHNKNRESNRPLYERLTARSWADKFPGTVQLYNKLNPEADFEKLASAVKKMWLDNTSSGHPNEHISKYTGPLLISRGDKDHLTKLTDVAELEGIVKNAPVFIIPMAAHDAFNQQPDLVSAGIRQFLKADS